MSSAAARIAVLLPLLALPATIAAGELADIAAPKPVTALSLPDGFAQRVVADGLTGAAGMVVTPDGRVLICEQTGTLRVVKDDALLPEPALTLANLDTLWERGLIGVEIDPDFAANGFIYCVYVAAEPFTHHRVSRFTLDGDAVVPGSEKILLKGDDQSTLGGGVPAGHQGGGIRFGADGMLYVVIGEQTAGDPSQSLATFQGKALRIARDGSIPADNPFFDTADGKYRAIYGYGLRNPFALSVGPDRAMWVTDVGASTWEEVNVLEPGANYGWPETEGPTADSRFTGPAYAYGDGGPRSISAGLWHSPPEFPSDRRGYFFTDYMQGWVKHLDPADPTVAVPFAAGLNGPVALATEPDGSLLVLCRNAWVRDGEFVNDTGTLHRVWFPGLSPRPAPRLLAQPTDATVPEGTPARFAVAAAPADSENLTYRWTVDGATVPGASGPELLIDNPRDGGRVQCVVEGGAAAVASRTARLRVAPLRPATGGDLNIDRPGVVRFRLTSATGAKLLIAGREIAAVPPYGGDRAAVGEIGLAAGSHAAAVVGGGTVEMSRGDGWEPVEIAAGNEAIIGEGAPLAASVFVPETIDDLPPKLSDLGVFADLETLEPAAGAVPYSTASPLWSDGALKRRWVILPAGAEIGFDPVAPWDYPAGTVFIKHFELGDADVDPRQRRRLETRVIRVDRDGLGWGATYRWGDSRDDAELVAAEGLTETVAYQTAGEDWEQTWTYPSRTACGQCHTAAAGFVLGAQAKQLHGALNHDSPGDFFDERPASQLAAWAAAGLFAGEPTDDELLAGPKLVDVNDESAPAARRGRSYLDANCSNCHRPGGARGGFDLRISTPWEEAGLVNNKLFSADLGVENARVLVPGEPGRSMLWLRLARRGDQFAMPPVGSHAADPAAVNVVKRWIEGMDDAGGSATAANFSLPLADDAENRKDPAAGTFLVPHGYARGPQENTFKNGMFRVNAPGASVDPEHGGRAEAKGNGMMLIDFPHDPRDLAGVRLDVSIWCGHPGTQNRAVTVNGRSTYAIPGPAGAGQDPQVGHVHETFELKPSDVVNGWNALQFTCEDGSSFWGHYIVDSATLTAVLKPGSETLKAAGLDGFGMRSIFARSAPRGDAAPTTLLLSAVADRYEDAIEKVVYAARYRGFDEDGSGDGSVVEAGWHGFPKDGETIGAIGAATESPFAVEWDTSMLPAQTGVQVRATVRFKNGMIYESPAMPAPLIEHAAGVTVNLYGPDSVPTPFWTREGEKKSCVIDVPHDPADVERAELHVVLWDGEHGDNADLVTLNGEVLPGAIGPGDHETYYRVVPIPPGLLKRGPNEFAVRAETTHHGIEVLAPGPAIAVRAKR